MKTTEQLQELYDVHKRNNLTVKVKPKIAICYSGQTRHINEDPCYTDDFYDILSLFSEFDCDLYGHTWSDQEDPNQEILKNFKDFQKTDQEDIWNAVKLIDYKQLCFWNFLPGNSHWPTVQEYKDVVNGNEDFIDFAKQRIKGGIGQVWSAHECFKLVKAQSHGEYTYVVRLRWDLKIQYQYGKDVLAKLKDQFRDVLKTMAMPHPAKPPTSRTTHPLNNTWDVLTTDMVEMNPCMYLPYINDHVFVIRGSSFRDSIIVKKSPIQILQDIAKDNDQSSFPSAHSLWITWLFRCEFRVVSALPDITTGNGHGEGKINKEWNF